MKQVQVEKEQMDRPKSSLLMVSAPRIGIQVVVGPWAKGCFQKFFFVFTLFSMEHVSMNLSNIYSREHWNIFWKSL